MNGTSTFERKAIVVVRNDDDNPPLQIKYRDSKWGVDGPEATLATLEELADLCDQDAESDNAHDLVGVHRLMAAVLNRHVGRNLATDIMRDVAEMGGLHTMNGLGDTDATAFRSLDISQPWHSWQCPSE